MKIPGTQISHQNAICKQGRPEEVNGGADTQPVSPAVVGQVFPASMHSDIYVHATLTVK